MAISLNTYSTRTILWELIHWEFRGPSTCFDALGPWALWPNMIPHSLGVWAHRLFGEFWVKQSELITGFRAYGGLQKKQGFSVRAFGQRGCGILCISSWWWNPARCRVLCAFKAFNWTGWLNLGRIRSLAYRSSILGHRKLTFGII